MKILSLFDGISCGQVALERAGVYVEKYYASEIDKNAMKVTQHNYPNTIQLGDVTKVIKDMVGQIDLLIGGSPCQGFSFAGKQLNFSDPRSALFFEYVRLLKELRPKYFLLENVLMKKEYMDVITEHLGVGPVVINSNLLSAQDRDRIYWTNIPNVSQPKDRGLFIKDIIEPGSGKMLSEQTAGRNRTKKNIRNYNQKSKCLLATMYKLAQANGMTVIYDNGWRCLSPIECERLQTLPDNYTDCISNTQRYAVIGNAWTVDIIAHIFSGIK